MASWNKVLSGFDKEEETVNFGTRIIAENNGSLYETFTLATIQSDTEVTYYFCLISINSYMLKLTGCHLLLYILNIIAC